MEELMAEIAKADVKAFVGGTEGLLTSWVTQSASLAEHTTTTLFNIVRDVRGELNDRIVGTISWVEGSQQGLIKLVKGINDRINKLSGDTLDTAESLAIGVIRAARDTGHGVTGLATTLTTARASRAA
jgi:hypothetical protein